MSTRCLGIESGPVCNQNESSVFGQGQGLVRDLATKLNGQGINPTSAQGVGIGTLLEHSGSQISPGLVTSQVVPERLKLLQLRSSRQECLQVRVWISGVVRKSWGITVRDLDRWQKKPCHQDFSLRNPRQRDPTLFQPLHSKTYHLLSFLISAAKRARTFGGGSKPMPSFPLIMDEGGRQVRSFCLV